MYGCWRLTCLEPALYKQRFFPDQRQDYLESLCPVAEGIQPQLLQFKTNYWDDETAAKQAEALHQTIQYFQ